MDFSEIAEEIIDNAIERAKKKAKTKNSSSDEYIYFQAYMTTEVERLLDKEAYKVAKLKTIQKLEEEIMILKSKGTKNNKNERNAGRKPISEETINAVKKLKSLYNDYSSRKISELLRTEKNINLSHTKIAEILKKD